MAGEGKGAVFIALLGNGILTLLKGAAFMVSGSGAMLSEAVHSAADTANQGLLYFGMRRSLRPADSRFHYGYGADRYVFALMSAMGIFILGCGVTVYHGVHSLFHPPDLTFSWIIFGVLGASLVVDGYVLLVAVREVNTGRGDKTLFQFIRTTTDPTLIAVLFEDAVATLGVIVAMIGIALSIYTGNPIYDSLSSIMIGAMLGIMAIWLGWRNRQLILGPAIPEKLQSDVLAFLKTQDSVDSVRQFRTRVVAADSFRIAAEIDYNGQYLGRRQADWLRQEAAKVSKDEEWADLAGAFGERFVTDLGDEIDRIESELFERFPKIRHIDIEAD
jgi:zinc transporter 9